MYWYGGGNVSGEVIRGDNGKLYSDVGIEVGNGDLEEVELEIKMKFVLVMLVL